MSISHHVRLLAVLLIGAAPCLFGAASTAVAQEAAQPLHTLKAADYEAMFKVPRPALGKRAEATAEIIVRYVDFPQEAEDAFQHAVDIWETHVSSPVPIYMVAQWAELDERTLGSAGPTFIFNNDELTQPPFSFSVPPLPRDDVWYPGALAVALAGERLSVAQTDCGSGSDSGLPVVQGECPDMIATFNSELDVDGDGDVDWSFALDPQPAQIRGEYHLTTVVLHEIGHGIGFFDTFNFDDGEGEEECPDGPVGSGCWGFAWQGNSLPIIFDLFVEDANDNRLIDTGVYPNPSQALGDVLQSNAVFFAGEAVTRANTDVPADLYAPDNFEPGSSTAHFDEETFNNTPNALMTPQLARSEVILSPGPLFCSLLFDIGWPMGPDCAPHVNLELLAFSADAVAGGATVTWEVAADTSFSRFVIERSQLADCELVECREEEERLDFVPFDTVEVEPGKTRYQRAVDAGSLPGRYVVQLQLCRGGCDERGERGEVDVVVDEVDLFETQEIVLPVEETVITSVYPNPFIEGTEVNLVLDASQETCRGEAGEKVDVRVYNSLGRLVTRLFDGCILERRPVRIRLPATDLAAGVYFIRIEGETFAETREAVKL